MKFSRTSPGRLLLTLGLGLLIGRGTAGVPFVDPAVGDEKNPTAFKSGGERAAETLEKISTQLQGMDKRLETIEQVISEWKKARYGTAVTR